MFIGIVAEVLCANDTAIPGFIGCSEDRVHQQLSLRMCNASTCLPGPEPAAGAAKAGKAGGARGAGGS